MAIKTIEEKMEVMELIKETRKTIEARMKNSAASADTLKLWDCFYELALQDAVSEPGSKSTFPRRFAFDMLMIMNAGPSAILAIFDTAHELVGIMLEDATARACVGCTEECDHRGEPDKDEPINGKGEALLKIFEGGKNN